MEDCKKKFDKLLLEADSDILHSSIIPICLVKCFMHWLHGRPNSDFPENRHFFGRFLSFYRQIFCRFFSAKFKRRIGIRHTFGFFSPFLSLSANFRILENRIWQIFGLFARHLAKFSEKLRRKKSFFSDFGGEFWAKNCQKPAYKVPNWRKIGIRPHV